MFYYHTDNKPRVSVFHSYVLVGLIVAVIYSLVLAATDSIPWACIYNSCPSTHITLLSTLGYAKIAVNLVKNFPQLLLSYQRPSTVSWSIWGVLSDVLGGSPSFTQQCLDAYNYVIVSILLVICQNSSSLFCPCSLI